MRNIDYTLIGSIAEVEQYRDTLPEIITAYCAGVDTLVAGNLIEQCAQNFYGFRLEEFETMAELIDAIRGADQDLEFS